MALTRQEPLLIHEQISGAVLNGGTVWTSKLIPYGGEAGWIVVIRVLGTITGTTPTLTPALQTTTVAGGGSGMATLGAIAAFTTTAGASVTVFTAGSNPIPANTTAMQVILTLGGTTPVYPDVTVELIALE